MALKKKVIQGGLDVQKSDGTSALTVDETTGTASLGVGNETQLPSANLVVHGGTGDGDSYNTSIALTRKSSTSNRLAFKLVANDKNTNYTNLDFVAKTTASQTENAAYYTTVGTIDGETGTWTIGPSAGTSTGTHTIQNTSTNGQVQVATFITNGRPVNTSGNYYLQFNSNSGTDGFILVSGTTLVIADASDSRKKENVREANFGLAQVNALRPVLFDWKEEFGGEKDVKGFLAQEVESVLPECVTTRDESEQGGFADSKFLATTNMIPVLVKAIQELSAQVEELKAEVAALRGQ